MSHAIRLWVTSFVLLIAFAWAQPAGYPSIHVAVTDAGVTVPTSLEAGFYSVHVDNQSSYDYGPDLLQVKDGVSVEQVVAAVNDLILSFMGQADPAAATRNLMDVAVIRGGSSTPSAVFELVPGEYLVVALGASEEGRTFTDLGLYTTLTVTAAATAVEAPASDLVVELSEYAFSVPEQISAGARTWHVHNVGDQPHHVVLMKIQPGRTMDDVMAFLDDPESGPPPADEVGYTPVMSPDMGLYATWDLEPGMYVALCFIGDVEDGAPHAVHGMVQAFEVVASN